MSSLQGHTLGQRHAYYNTLVKRAAAAKPTDFPKINYYDTDVDNMIRIDMACNNRDVDYILEVLKCNDMLYVSRAIKKIPWLVTETQYAHLINPTYLHRELFPHMNPRAVSKLMLLIRCRLKNESRVKDFYWYVFKKNSRQATRWLQNCSKTFVEKRYSVQAIEIQDKVVTRLCRKSFKILEIYNSFFKHVKTLDEEYEIGKTLLKNHVDEFLNLIDNTPSWRRRLTFDKKRTAFILKKYPQRIHQNDQMDINFNSAAILQSLKSDEIKPFCIKMAKLQPSSWDLDSLTPYLEKMPRHEVLDLLRIILAIRNGTWVEPNETEDHIDHSDISSVSIDTLHKEDSINTDNEERGDVEELFYALEGVWSSDFWRVYRWYRFAPFEVAFPDIRKFIFAESSSEERHNMLVVLLTCASYDFNHVKTVIKYYHDKHINEPYHQKITFVDSVISQHDTFRFDDATWEILNNLYKSLEVYIDSTNRVQECLVSVIVYNVLRDQPVPEIVEEKFTLETMQGLRKKLNLQEQDKLFNYLSKLAVSTLLNQATDSETGLRDAIGLLKHVWCLLNDWQKVETHYQFVIDKVVELGNVNKNSKWNETIKKRRLYRRRMEPRRRYDEFGQVKEPKPYVDIPSIYHMVKPYRKDLFESSLVLHACEDVCLNALKHDIGLLERYSTELQDLRLDNRVCLNRFLRKLRIYWPDSQWAEMSIANLANGSGYKALIRGLLVVLPHKQVLELVDKYAPIEKKINWRTNVDETNVVEVSELTIQKYVASNMHLVRPQLPIEVIMRYTKGDYLQYGLRSLLSAYSTLKSRDFRKFIEILLDSPVSAQKHGIRLGFAKLKTEILVNLSKKSWQSGSNPTIRTLLFTSVLDLLCKEKKTMWISPLWTTLSSFIDDLKTQENSDIYLALGNRVRDVPYSVIGEYFPKTYLFLKPLSVNRDVSSRYQFKHIIEDMFAYAAEIIEYLDSDFVEKSLLGRSSGLSGCAYWACNEYPYASILTNYLLYSKDFSIQTRKYNNLLRPLVETYCRPKFFQEFTFLMSLLCRSMPRFVFEKKMVMPVQLLTNLSTNIVEGPPSYVEQFYSVITRWKITLDYVNLIDTMISSEPSETWDKVRTKSTQALAKICLERLTDDIDQFFPSIHLIYGVAMGNVLNDFGIQDYDRLHVLDTMLDGCANEAIYLLVLNMMSDSNCPQKVDVIRSKIYCHPSSEVNLHYVQKFSEKYTEVIKES